MCLVLVSADVTLTIFYKEKIGVVLLCRDQGVVEDAHGQDWARVMDRYT